MGVPLVQGWAAKKAAGGWDGRPSEPVLQTSGALLIHHVFRIFSPLPCPSTTTSSFGRLVRAIPSLPPPFCGPHSLRSAHALPSQNRSVIISPNRSLLLALFDSFVFFSFCFLESPPSPPPACCSPILTLSSMFSVCLNLHLFTDASAFLFSPTPFLPSLLLDGCRLPLFPFCHVHTRAAPF